MDEVGGPVARHFQALGAVMAYAIPRVNFDEQTGELIVRLKLPADGEPAKSGHSDNLTDPTEWVNAEVIGRDGVLIPITVKLVAVAPYRRRRRPTHVGNWTTSGRFTRSAM